MIFRTNESKYRAGFIVLTILSYALLVVWPDLMAAPGVGYGDFWFRDLNALLMARTHNLYSDWWLQLHYFGLGGADRLWLGSVLVGAFFIAIFWRVRPRTFGQMLLAWLVVWSPPVILGVNRANPDLLIFVLLAPVSDWMSAATPERRGGAFVLIFLAIGLKYYPAAALGLIFATARNRRDLGWQLLIWSVLGAILWWNLSDDIARMHRLMEPPTGFFAFGLSRLTTPTAFLGILISLLAAGYGWLRCSPKIEDLQRSGEMHFILGSCLLVSCFFLVVNYAYRLVFSIWLLPWLFDLDKMSDHSGSVYARVLMGSTLFLLWIDGLSVMALNSVIGMVPRAILTESGIVLQQVRQVIAWVWVWLLFIGLGVLARHTWKRWLSSSSAIA